MKKYIKPNTDINEIELTQMIALSKTEQTSHQVQLGNETSIFESDDRVNSSVWDEEE